MSRTSLIQPKAHSKPIDLYKCYKLPHLSSTYSRIVTTMWAKPGGTQDAINSDEMVGTVVPELPDTPRHEPDAPKVKNACTVYISVNMPRDSS